MYQNFKWQRFNKIVVVISILILLLTSIFAVRGFFAPASGPIEAAEQEYQVAYARHRYTGTSTLYEDYCYCYVFLTCDNLGIRSITFPTLKYYNSKGESISSSSTDTSIYWRPSLNLTINLSGYSWISSVTSFSATYGRTAFGARTLDDAKSTATNNLGASKYGGTTTFTRSGNSFTSTVSLSFYSTHFSSNHEFYSVLYIDLEKPTDSISANSYTLTFNYNGGNILTSSKTVTYNSVIGTLPAPTRENYIFDGWYIGSTKLTETRTWTYTANQTATAQWTFDGYTLAYSVDNDIGGSIVGASTQYAKNSSVTVTASPAEGYVFDHWVLNGTSATANPLTFTITQNSTLVAYFREIPNVTVTISGDIQCDIQKTVDSDAFIVVTPPTSNYVCSITIDGKVFPIQYYHANVYGAGEAHLISYTVRDTSNTFSIYFENLFGSSTLEISLVNVKPTYQNPPLGGASVEGVATQATVGGETRVTGVDTSSANATVHLSAISYAGYVFTGWTASDGTDLSAYGSSADIPYSLIEGKIITANFTSTSNSSANGITDNQDEDGTPEII